MSLDEAFQEVDGVGPATAEKLVGIVERHESSGGVDPEVIERALGFMDNKSMDAARSVLEGALAE